MKFVLLVEGYAEKEALAGFFKRWLDSQLKQPVGIKIDRFGGCGDFLAGFARKARKFLDEPGADLIAVIGLLDLYGPENFYPAHLATVQQRLDWATPYLEKQVERERFRMFFAVHELEAWLLSSPELFPAPVKRAFPGKIRHPEEVNFDEPPARLIDRLYQAHLSNARRVRKYNKRVEGRVLFDQLDPHLVYTKCPNFACMMDEMLRLAQEAGL